MTKSTRNSSQFTFENMDLIQQNRTPDGKINLPKAGVGLAVLIVLRLCSLMNVRSRIWQSLKKVRAIPAKLRDVPQDMRGETNEIEEILSASEAMYKKLRMALVNANHNVDYLCEMAETLAETMSNWADKSEGIRHAVALLSATVDSARTAESAQAPETITDDVRELISRVSGAPQAEAAVDAPAAEASDESKPDESTRQAPPPNLYQAAAGLRSMIEKLRKDAKRIRC